MFSVFFSLPALVFQCLDLHVFCILLSIAWDILVLELFLVFMIRFDVSTSTYLSFS